MTEETFAACIVIWITLVLIADDWNLTDEQRQELADDTLDMVIRCYDEALEPYEAYIVRNGDVYQRVSGADLPGCDTDERRDLIARIDSAIAEGIEPLYERATAMERD